MQTHPDCIHCFLEQIRSTACLCSRDPELQQFIVHETAKLLEGLDMELSPPENAVGMYRKMADASGIHDPFAVLKKESNDFALTLQERVKHTIETSSDPLYSAVRYSIAGNIIDYGARHKFDALQTLTRCMDTELAINDYRQFQKDIFSGKTKNILYLADNCGEIVFDALLIEQLLELGHKVICAVRGEEIINDATMEDANDIGLLELCQVVTSGTPCPGTPLGSVSEELRQAFNQADIIISKGQGNFETLSETAAPLYFFLTVKCPVVARHITTMKDLPVGYLVGNGEMVLMQKEKKYAGTAD